MTASTDREHTPSRESRLTDLHCAVLWLTLLLAAVSAAGCRTLARDDVARIARGGTIAIRPNELTRTVAVLWSGDDPTAPQRIDVYRMISGELPTIWPSVFVSSLKPDQRESIRACQLQRLASWEFPDNRRVDGLWSVGADGSVLTHEYRLAILERRESLGRHGSTLVMRDSDGIRLWELSPSDLFSPAEQSEFMPYPHSYDWIVGVAFVPDTGSVCVFARGGHFRTIGIQDGRVGSNIVDDYSYAR